MSDYFDHVEQELCRAVRRHAYLPWYVRLRLRHSRALIVAFACIVIGGPALAAAAGVFQSGPPVASDVPATPHANDGVAIADTVSVLGLRFVDPGGGPPWGLRLDRTTRGLVCVQPGRVEFGTVGALGIDHALGNDGRFHPFSNNYLEQAGCGSADGRGHAFVATTLGNVPASAIEGSCAPNYLSHSPTGRQHEVAVGRGPICPSGSLRDISYGVLGPDAVSITYADPAGHLITIPTAGADGAFLVVSAAAAHCPSRAFGTGRQRFVSTYCIGATIGTNLTPGVIRKVTYRSGQTCTLPLPNEIAATRISCPSVGYVAPAARPITSAQVATPLTVHNAGLQYLCVTGRGVTSCGAHPPVGSRRGPGPSYYAIVVSFTARVAVTDIDSYYLIAIHYPPSHTATCQIGGSTAPTTQDLRAGQRVHFHDFIPQYCTGTFHVLVSYKQPRTSAVRVGQNTVTLTPKRSHHR